MDMESQGATGTISVFTYPAYCAFAVSAGEHVPAERRGLITWQPEADRPGHVVGYANPVTPRGEWAFIAYYQSPNGPAVMVGGFDHPIRAEGGPKHVAPILYDGETMTAQVS